MVLCKFVNNAVADEYLARALTAVTGVEYTTGDIHRVGERIWNLERLYNLREGFTRKRRHAAAPPARGTRAGRPSQWLGGAPGADAGGILPGARLGQSRRAHAATLKRLGLDNAYELDAGVALKAWMAADRTPKGRYGAHAAAVCTSASQRSLRTRRIQVIDERLYQQFRDIGRDLYVGRADQLARRQHQRAPGRPIVIKRRGAMLGQLKPEDLIETGLEKNDSGVILASTELIVHRAIYKSTPALAIVHAHSRTAIALSLSRDEILPIDNEASYLLKKVPVFAGRVCLGHAGDGEYRC